jgi:hypothetical protein
VTVVQQLLEKTVVRLTHGSILLLALAAGSANAGSSRDDHVSQRRQTMTAPAVGPRCPEAGRARVVLPDGLDGIDGFRVYVATARPGAATDVTVLAAGRDRTLRAFAPGVLALSLDQPLRGRTVDVAIEPVLEASLAACVERVELLRGGAVVGFAEIR